MTLTITVRLRGIPAGGVSASAGARAAAAHRGTSRPGSGPGAGRPGGTRQRDDSPAPATCLAGTLLPLAEPAALLLAEAAGLGVLGRVLLATAFRSAQRVLAE